ncbi:NHL repeat-containing protein 3 isoform X1 [Sinocyclocheilus rhinocerous]|uniref:NHL repeat-containing protein 3 n=1 Tax=Sinocyclocheilus rhinocerous TaxID=307959 RepID=A0A673GZU6_9TELE|nr:PREDICTED: NHL repeat-containing protein 3 isoform X1 [Sinocyclocheilus rhinocerous]XP_016385810.1 PREDICTED: NHL repeat-containing protein 3 isoform X1 [Sinocyclocheilus rhinocerous]
MRRRSCCCLIAVGMAILLFIIFICGSISSHVSVASRSQSEFRVSGRALYKLDISWPKNPEYFTGQVFGVAVNHLAGLVYVAQRGDNVPKVLVFSTDGDFLQAWNTSSLEMPHGIFLANASADPTVWITDVGNGPYGHTVKQYSPSGKLLQVLGSPGKAGSSLSPLQFDQPAEIFVHSSGEIYIVDGDGGMNNRLIKLSRDLQVLWMHGEKGQGLAQFYIPHSVAVDSYQRVWVADRGNKRIQVFNSVTGDWLGSWGSCFKEDAPYSVRLTPDQKYMVVAQLNTNQVTLLEAPPIGIIGQCQVTSSIQLAEDVKPHLVDVDLKSAALYVAEIGANQAQKFIPVTATGV